MRSETWVVVQQGNGLAPSLLARRPSPLAPRHFLYFGCSRTAPSSRITLPFK
jgi:hypothetical protein